MMNVWPRLGPALCALALLTAGCAGAKASGTGPTPGSTGRLVTLAQPSAPIEVLVVTATQGFRHAGAIQASKELLAQLDSTTGFDFDFTEDLDDLTPANLAKYDVLFLDNATLRDQPAKDSTAARYTPVTDAQVQAIVDFVRGGKGLVVAHAGLSALYGSEAFRQMVGGGLFKEHPWKQAARVDVEDRTNPADTHLGDSFPIRDEFYILDRNPRWNSHVLLSLNMPSVGVTVGSPGPTADDYPLSWIRTEGRGRVFITALGHFPDVWRNPAFVRHLLVGMREAAGTVPADFSGHRVKQTIARDVWPDDVVADSMGNVWIAEITGRVLRYDGGTGETRTVAEIPTVDPTNTDHGLKGIEIDPDFYEGQPYVYVYRGLPESYDNVLSRYTFHDGRIDLSTEKDLLRVPTEPACCHQSGDLEWGPDGTLFISAGDTGESTVRP
ncbi:MAG TPA: ThuA domain-containing protein, partial [Longimicrobiaceae bacterium]|nr:ThuA domain-containing protein [Longimicrobiaceae bacterium]